MSKMHTDYSTITPRSDLVLEAMSKDQLEDEVKSLYGVMEMLKIQLQRSRAENEQLKKEVEGLNYQIRQHYVEKPATISYDPDEVN